MKKKIMSLMSLVLIVTSIITMCIPAMATEEQVTNAEFTGFELPLKGTTGWGVIDLVSRGGDGSNYPNWGTVTAGTPFTILEEGTNYFYIMLPDTNTCWVSKKFTMVNLPDLIPSIRYDITDGYQSDFHSLGYDLPDITGKKLYEGKTWNAKLGYEEFNVPVLYSMAKRIQAAQTSARYDGRTLVIYEAFRPYAVQMAISSALSNLMASNKTVNNNINYGGWGKGWFIATKMSNHQKGYAIDVSLAKITSWTNITVSNGKIINVPATYEEYVMPTAMHELSTKAVALQWGVNSLSATAWKSVPMASTMTYGSRCLRAYCTNAGLSPLSSEWWHFNDLNARNETGGQGSGRFYITGNLSVAF